FAAPVAEDPATESSRPPSAFIGKRTFADRSKIDIGRAFALGGMQLPTRSTSLSRGKRVRDILTWDGGRDAYAQPFPQGPHPSIAPLTEIPDDLEQLAARQPLKKGKRRAPLRSATTLAQVGSS